MLPPLPILKPRAKWPLKNPSHKVRLRGFVAGSPSRRSETLLPQQRKLMDKWGLVQLRAEPTFMAEVGKLIRLASGTISAHVLKACPSYPFHLPEMELNTERKLVV